MVVVVDVVFISGRDLPSREALQNGFFPEFARIEMQWSGRQTGIDTLFLVRTGYPVQRGGTRPRPPLSPVLSDKQYPQEGAPHCTPCS